MCLFGRSRGGGRHDFERVQERRFHIIDRTNDKIVGDRRGGRGTHSIDVDVLAGVGGVVVGGVGVGIIVGVVGTATVLMDAVLVYSPFQRFELNFAIDSTEIARFQYFD